MIKVSDINVYLKCPRMCYFLNRGYDLKKATGPEYIQSILIKELALTYGNCFNSHDNKSFLNDELSRISDEIRVIYRNELAGIDDTAIVESVSNVRTCLDKISSNLSLNANFYANDFEADTLLLSEKHGFRGSPDKLIRIDDKLVPSIIKTGNIPQNGVWHGDRIQLTAYSILVEEKYGSIIEQGFVEYARWGEVRGVTIKRHERRKVLQVRDKIRKIQEGIMPEKPKDSPCERCGFTEMCDVKSTLASKFF